MLCPLHMMRKKHAGCQCCVHYTCLLHKFMDDTTLTEIIPKAALNNMDLLLCEVLSWSGDNLMNINWCKIKEMILGTKPAKVSISDCVSMVMLFNELMFLNYLLFYWTITWNGIIMLMQCVLKHRIIYTFKKFLNTIHLVLVICFAFIIPLFVHFWNMCVLRGTVVSLTNKVARLSLFRSVRCA